MSPERAEWVKAIDLENWKMCETVYAMSGRATIHRNHVHRGRPAAWMVWDDLRTNDCREILRDYWIEY